MIFGAYSAQIGQGHPLRNLPLHGFAQNQIWCELAAMACELTAWMQMLALDSPARAGEPKRLRLRPFSAAGRIVSGGRRIRLRIARRASTCVLPSRTPNGSGTGLSAPSPWPAAWTASMKARYRRRSLR
jgi:hypothetical protein